PSLEGEVRVMSARMTALLGSYHDFPLLHPLPTLRSSDLLLAIAVPSYLSFKARANKSAAQANVRAVLPDVESYNADNTVGNTTNDPSGATGTTDTDTGHTAMTAGLLKSWYDQAFPPSVWI